MRNIPGFCISFTITENGDVFRNGRRVSVSVNSSGYPSVAIYRENGVRTKPNLHRLVCLAFHGLPPSDRHQAAHNDGNKHNCHKDNIRWATPKENQADRKRHGTDPVGGRNPRAALSSADVSRIRAAFDGRKARYGEVAREAKRYGVTRRTIQNVIRNKTWTNTAKGKRT